MNICIYIHIYIYYYYIYIYYIILYILYYIILYYIIYICFQLNGISTEVTRTFWGFDQEFNGNTMVIYVIIKIQSGFKGVQLDVSGM